MGQIKNIKLHIVTDIKWRYTLLIHNSLWWFPAQSVTSSRNVERSSFDLNPKDVIVLDLVGENPKVSTVEFAGGSKDNILCPVLGMGVMLRHGICVPMDFVNSLFTMSKMLTLCSC